MHININNYYVILGVNSSASITDIKKAFRNKAKQFHPDKNPNTDTQEQFIKITEAYEYLLNYKKNPNDYTSDFIKEDAIKEEEENKARERAERVAYARQKYEEFKKTDFYKNDQAFLILLNHFQFFIIILLVSLPILFLSNVLFNNKLIGVILSLTTVFIVQKFYKKHNNLDARLLFKALKRILNIKQVQYTLSILFSLFLFFNYTLNTQISSFNLAVLFFGLYIIVGIFAKTKKNQKKILIKIFLVGIPLIFNLFFFLNFQFSYNSEIEKHNFKHQFTGSGSHLEKTSTIQLKNNLYKNQSWFRFFFNFNKMKDKTEISYHFKKGIFGLRVLESYEFTK